MNTPFKFILAGVTAATTIVAGEALSISSAQALSITPGSTFQISSATLVKISPSGFDFDNNSATSQSAVQLTDVLLPDGFTSDPQWSPYAGTIGTVQDVSFSPSLPFPNFLSFNLIGPPNSGALAFDLLSPFTTTVIPKTGQDTFDATFNVLIRNALTGNVLGNGLLTAQVKDGFIVGSSTGASTFSISVTAIPTPALLPGLLALGAGVLRKRKVEAAEEVAES